MDFRYQDAAGDHLREEAIFFMNGWRRKRRGKNKGSDTELKKKAHIFTDLRVHIPSLRYD